MRPRRFTRPLRVVGEKCFTSRLQALGWIAGGLLLLGVVRLLPAEGVGLALRLAVPAALVLLLPGGLVVARLGAPGHLGVALAAALAWSLAILFTALVLTFLVAGSLTLTLALVAATTFATALAPRGGAYPRPPRAEWLPVAAVAAGGAVYGVAVWLAARPLRGDALFHMARARKLDALPSLDSLRALSEF